MKTLPAAAQRRFLIDDMSKVGEARRAAQTLANFEFTAEQAGKVAIVATELASNLLRHAGGGELLLQSLGSGEDTVIELLAVDRGPGMSDVAQCMRDGYSTAGTLGAGLGAVRRLADAFDLHSQPGEGTLVMARFGKADALRYGAINLAMEAEIDCGDAWQVECSAEATAIMMVDGLGHGTFAAEAARVGIDAFIDSPFSTPLDTITRAGALMTKTRGGAAACALIKEGRLSYAGVGNISGRLLTPQRSQGLVSHNGTLGLGQRRVQQFEYACAPGTLLVMHSDGISTRWDVKNLAGVLDRHPAIIAAAIYREHARGNDDITVLVVPA